MALYSSSTSASNGGGVTAAAPPGFRTLKEGTASILYEHDESGGKETEPVFYNKVQVLNRDLSIKMITLFARQRLRERVVGNPNGNRAARRQAKVAAKQAASAAAEGEAGAAAAGDKEAAPETVAAAAAAAEPAAAVAVGDVGASRSSSAGAGAAAAGGVAGMSSAELDAKLRAEASTSGIRILDALAATGLRSIRYYKEVKGSRRFIRVMIRLLMNPGLTF
jgi:tRNA (guanine26-N2/guanine27-N2)-dimethyltransferase